MHKNKKSTISISKYVLISVLILVISITISLLVGFILSLLSETGRPIEYVSALVEGIIASVATGLVLYQLKVGEKTERHQGDIEEASFTLQFNQAFIQDENMVKVEELLENQAYYDTQPKEIVTPENRQKFINYLVYLESMAPLILSGVLDLQYIDNLMAYRFFLAIDNKELQDKEILPFAEYYRGCFKLYRIWKQYRDEHGYSCPKDDCKNQTAMRSLSSCKEFEKICNS